MKIAITSDWHIEEGIYTDICINFLDYLSSFCNKKMIDHIIVAGDIFEKSSKIKNEAFLPLFFKLMEMKNNGFKMFFVLGNHDIFNIENDSLVESFMPFGEVIKKYKEYDIGGRTFSFLPYTKREDFPLHGDVLITHLSIANFTFDNKYHVNEKNGFPVELFEGWNMVFSGHFHRPQNKKNIVYIGSPYQMNFGEIGQNKGFVVFDTESNDWERIYYNESPKYVRIKAKDFDKFNVKNCFVEIEIEEKIDNYVKLKHLLYEKGAIEVVPSFKDTGDNITITENESNLNLNSGIVDMMKEYISNSSVDGIKNEKLIEIFEKVLE